MNRSVLSAAALITLAACGAERDADPVGNTPVAPVEVQTISPGLYAIMSDGTVYSRFRLAGDGTYADYDGAMNVTGQGTWSGSGSQMCFDPAGNGANEQESCWNNEPPRDDGSFMTRLVGGDTSYLIEPLTE